MYVAEDNCVKMLCIQNCQIEDLSPFSREIFFAVLVLPLLSNVSSSYHKVTPVVSVMESSLVRCLPLFVRQPSQNCINRPKNTAVAPLLIPSQLFTLINFPQFQAPQTFIKQQQENSHISYSEMPTQFSNYN